MRNVEEDVRTNEPTTMKGKTWNLQGNWNMIRGKLKQQYAGLTDDDLQYVEGKEDELLGRIQRRTGKSRKEIEDFIASC
ncbi:MAG TPA: CsbD family protein [Saprospiraceae bacterium]|nr:CsbD family protein [Saprospiraceae bacterium]